MAQIKAFKGTMYDTGSHPDLGAMLAPPYDIIGPELQERLYERSPFNVVRLILGKIFPDDSAHENRYTRAASDYSGWKERGILVTASSPAVYLYDQEFQIEKRRCLRRGFIALLRLEDFGERDVHPHEITYAEPRADRLNLLRACRANFSQVFALYSDEDRRVEETLHLGADAEPLADFEDDEGIRHTLRAVTDIAVQAKVRDLMDSRQIFIADGHHRYETALLYRNEMRGREVAPEDAPYDYVPALFVSSRNPGLCILPVHRVLPRGCERGDPVSLLGEHLELILHSADLADSPLNELLAWMGRADEDEHRFGLITPGGLYTVSLRRGSDLDRLIGGEHSPAWRRLDVSVIQELGIKKCLSPEELSHEGSLRYVTDAAEAMQEVAADRARLAFLVRPTHVSDIERIALAGEKMPPKSTYFHPKPLSGLVIYDHETGFPRDDV